MPKERTNIYIIERQKKQLQKRSEEESLPIAELIRRALDAYLAWDDPSYAPSSSQSTSNKEGPFIPGLKARGILARLGKVAEKILERLDGSAEMYEQKRQALRFILQSQARHLACFLRGDRDSYEPFVAGW